MSIEYFICFYQGFTKGAKFCPIEGTIRIPVKKEIYQERSVNEEGSLEEIVRNGIREMVTSDGDDKILNIWGKGGVGKTSLVSHVDVDKKSEDRIKELIKKYITDQLNGNAVLVTDDVFSVDAFYAIKGLFPNVIAISRENYSAFGDGDEILVENMIDKDIKKLVGKILYPNVGPMDDLKNEIVRKLALLCNGLPLVANIFSRKLLKFKNNDEAKLEHVKKWKRNFLTLFNVDKHKFHELCHKRDLEMWKMLLVDFHTRTPEERLSFYAFLIMDEGQDLTFDELEILWNVPNCISRLKSAEEIIADLVNFAYVSQVTSDSGNLYQIHAFLFDAALRYICQYETNDICKFLIENLGDKSQDFDGNKMEMLKVIRSNWLENVKKLETNENLFHLVAKKGAMKLLQVSMDILNEKRHLIRERLQETTLVSKLTPLDVLGRQIGNTKYETSGRREMSVIVNTLCVWVNMNFPAFTSGSFFLFGYNPMHVSGTDALVATHAIKDADCNAFFVSIRNFHPVFFHLLHHLPETTNVSNILDEHDNTLLHVVDTSSKITTPLIKALISKGIDTSRKNKYGMTALMVAASESNYLKNLDMAFSNLVGWENPLKVLLDACSDETVRATNNEGMSALSIARRFNRQENVSILLTRTNEQTNVLYGPISGLKLSIEEWLSRIGIKHFESINTAYENIWNYKFEEFKSFMRDNNVRITREMANSLLLLSCSRKNVKTTRYILDELDPNVNCTDTVGRTPLYKAIMKNNVEICEMLLATPGIEIDKDDFIGITPLLLSIVRDYSDIWKLLDRNGCNLNKLLLEFCSPLSLACFFGRVDFVKYICSLPTDRCDLTKRCNVVTPFQLSMVFEHYEIALCIANASEKQSRDADKQKEADEYKEMAKLAQDKINRNAPYQLPALESMD